MIEVAISGAGGRLATPIAEAVARTDDLALVALYNPNRAGQALNDLVVTGNPEEVGGEVLVETVQPDFVFDNLVMWRKGGRAVVVATSGFTPERVERLRELWADEGPPCLVVPNFSIGAVLMMRFAREAAARFQAVEIVERHHTGKRDAPSGTSLATAAGVAASGGASSEESPEMVPGARGALVEGVRVHSLRLPGLISQQEVALSNPGEVLSISHLSTSYESFVPGALLAIRAVRDMAPGVHVGLDAIL